MARRRRVSCTRMWTRDHNTLQPTHHPRRGEEGGPASHDAVNVSLLHLSHETFDVDRIELAIGVHGYNVLAFA